MQKTVIGTNQDVSGKDIILFNLMAGTCSKGCANCYDKVRPSSNMEPHVFKHYMKLTPLGLNLHF